MQHGPPGLMDEASDFKSTGRGFDSCPARVGFLLSELPLLVSCVQETERETLGWAYNRRQIEESELPFGFWTVLGVFGVSFILQVSFILWVSFIQQG